MQTIEQLEVEIHGKINTAIDQLAIFQANIGKIGQVIGKDSTEVYNKLKGHLDTLANEINTATLKSTAVYFRWQKTIDSILAVLAEVMASLEAINRSNGVDLLDVKRAVEAGIQKAADMVDLLTVNIVEMVTGDAANPSDVSIVNYVLVGGVTYFVLKMLDVGTVPALLGAAAVAWLLGGGKAPVTPANPVVPGVPAPDATPTIPV